MATEVDKLYVALGASLRDFDRGMEDAQDTIDDTDDKVDRLSRSLQELDRTGVEIDVDASEVASAKALVESIGDADVDVDANGSGTRRSGSAFSNLLGEVNEVGAAFGSLSASTLAFGGAVTAGVTAMVAVPAAIGGLSAAATAAAAQFGDVQIRRDLRALKAELRGTANVFATAFEPTIRQRVIPTVENLGRSARFLTGVLDRFTQKFGSGVFGAINNAIVQVTAKITAATLAFEGLVAVVDGVADALADPFTNRDDMDDAVTMGEQESVDLGPSDTAVKGFAQRVKKDVIEPALNEIAAIRGREDAGLISAQEEKEEIRSVRDALDQELRILKEKNPLLFRGIGDTFRENVRRLRALQPQEGGGQSGASAGPSFGDLPAAGPMLDGSAASRTPDRISLPKHLQKTKQRLMQASLSMRLFRSTGQQAMQAISANVGQTIGQILTFQTKVASLKGVFQSVGSAIVSSLQKIVAQLIKAVAQATILAAVMSLIPGFGQASFAGNFDKLLGGIMPFAEGGIVTGPTIGLVGEAGPEAVIPLDRMGEMGGQQGGTLNARIGMDELIFQMDRQLKARGQNGLIG